MYDPLVDDHIPSAQPKVNSVWAGQPQTDDFHSLESDLETEILIIGAGFTGLSCAYHLATEHQRQAVVIDANQPGWGCSGRNAGFALATTGRLGMAAIAKRYGADSAKGVYREYQQAVEWVKTQNAAFGLDSHYQPLGYLKLAHSCAAFDTLKAQAQLLSRDFADPVEVLSQQAIDERFGALANCGGILQPQCFGLNPLAYTQQLAQTCAGLGQRIYANTPALSITSSANGHSVATPKGYIRCKTLILATNAYGPRRLHSALEDRHFPVLSSVLVTQPLSPAQLAEAGLGAPFMAMDTRAMKYYYRLLPDNRLLFGGRGAIRGKNADSPLYRERLLKALKQTFPRIGNVEASYFWSGWVSVSLDDLPRLSKVDGVPPLYYAAGYCGAGVAFANWSGKRLAQMVCEQLPQDVATLPFYTSELKRFPLAEFRRLGLWGFYRWMELQSLFER